MSADTIPLTADEAINEFFRSKPQKRTTIDLNDDLLYVLLLVDGKFYVGRSKQFRKRLKSHFYRKSAWTRKYPPIEVVDLIQPVEDFDEDKITLRYMNQFGIDNVRGGSFSSIDLDPNDVSVIGRSVGGQIAAIQPPSLLTSPSRAAAPALSVRCSRCGRDGHMQSQCFASTSVDGRALTARPPATSRPELRLGNVSSQAATGVNPFHAAAAAAAHPSSWAPPLQPSQPSQTSQLTQPLHLSRPPPVSRPPP
eukprot:gene17242-12331_t